MEQVKSHKWIQEAMKHIKHGAFTREAARHHERPMAYAKEVLAHPTEHTLTTRRRAQFLMNIQRKK